MAISSRFNLIQVTITTNLLLVIRDVYDQALKFLYNLIE